MENISTLRRLADIISDAASTMERVYARSEMPLPSLDEPFNPDDPAETLKQDIEVEAARITVNSAHSFHISSCLLAASDLNIVEFLREAGPQGADVKKIAAPSGVDPDLLARILRLLATHHIFREVSPGVFANNRVSSTLDKGKPSSVANGNRRERLTGSSGIAALVEHTADFGGKAAVYLSDSLMGDPTGKTIPFNIAFKTDKAFFDWEHGTQEEIAYSLARFAVAMQGTAATEPADLIFQGFDWSLLPKNGIIVDVGGGIGHLSLTIAKKYPQLRVVLQDLGPPIEISKNYWRETFPAHLEANKVEFQVHDFFTSQPVKDAAIFLLRYILHDWNDAQAIIILGHLRAAAQPTTRLVILEKIIPFASVEDVKRSEAHAVPGATRPTAEAPLLPNWGVATADLYLYDVTMHALVGGVERTLQGFWDIFHKSGWNMIEVHHSSGSQVSQLVAAPT
ncbi:O-methyltransferase [Mycena pura]|uniref:O-methyltransferase n=1 Tax=Mycena pura TaxID=153505 RepID=A0AAD6V4B3_9AGAR|nr:O-methyltransferase [Mycena pura]